MIFLILKKDDRWSGFKSGFNPFYFNVLGKKHAVYHFQYVQNQERLSFNSRKPKIVNLEMTRKYNLHL